ncbi:nucleoside-diphosphate sugar epimerase domain protein [Mycobacterium intracellulare]|nr:nucleoside-diphosphate sugar epimerase domain protein [Mycobacterium intracellulare]
MYHRALWDAALSGPVNAVAPQPVRNAEYTSTLAAVLHRPAVLPVPSLGPRLLLGGRAPANWPARASGSHPASSSRPGTGSVNPT